MLQNSVLNTGTAPSASMIAKALKWQCFFGIVGAPILRRIAMSMTAFKNNGNLASYARRGAYALMIAASSYAMSGCDPEENGGTVEPKKEDPVLINKEHVVLNSQSARLSYVGDKPIFAVSTLSAEQTTGNLDSDIMSSGTFKVEFEPNDPNMYKYKLDIANRLVYERINAGEVIAVKLSRNDGKPIATDANNAYQNIIYNSSTLTYTPAYTPLASVNEDHTQAAENFIQNGVLVVPVTLTAKVNGQPLTFPKIQ